MRLAYSELIPPGDKGASFARNQFLWAVQRVADHVVEELARDVLPIWMSLMTADPPLWYQPEGDDPPPADYVTPVGAEEALGRWAARHRIDEPWVREKVSNALFLWQGSLGPALRGKLLLSGGALTRNPATGDTDLLLSTGPYRIPFTEDIQPPRYAPWRESEAEADREWAKYKQSVRSRCEEQGWTEPPTKRVRNESPMQHFEWLAAYQVLGESYREIAQKVTDADPEGNTVIGEEAVRKAVFRTAQLIGLSLRT